MLNIYSNSLVNGDIPNAMGWPLIVKHIYHQYWQIYFNLSPTRLFASHHPIYQPSIYLSDRQLDLDRRDTWLLSIDYWFWPTTTTTITNGFQMSINQSACLTFFVPRIIFLPLLHSFFSHFYTVQFSFLYSYVVFLIFIEFLSSYF